MFIRILATAALMLASMGVSATEFAERNRINAYLQLSFRQENFHEIEARYAEAVAKKSRLDSGLFISDEMVDGLRTATSAEQRAWKTGKVPEAERTTREFQEEAIIAVEEKVHRWRKFWPKSSLAATALVEAYIDHAFFYRGVSASREVKYQAHEKFKAYIEKARTMLLSPEITRDVVWYAAMIKLNKYQRYDDKEFAKLLEEAATRFPDSYLTYFWAVPSLQPKWGGSIDAYEWLARLALTKTHKTDGMALYARVYWMVSSMDEPSNLFTTTHADWKKMNQGFEDMHKRYPSEWNANFHALYACFAKDGTTLKKLFSTLDAGSKLDPQLWTDAAFLARCRRIAKDA